MITCVPDLNLQKVIFPEFKFGVCLPVNVCPHCGKELSENNIVVENQNINLMKITSQE